VVIADEACPRRIRKNPPHDAAKRILDEKVVADLIAHAP
jgi:hypothetical protein